MTNRKLKRLIRKEIYDLLSNAEKTAGLVKAQTLADILKCL